MNRDEAREYIKSHVDCRDYLEKSPKGNYCCPICGSGYGEHRSGALAYYPKTNTTYCFSCNQSYDVIDLYQAVNEGMDYNTALQELAEIAGITIDSSSHLPMNRTTAKEVFTAADCQLAEGPENGHTSAENIEGNNSYLENIKTAQNENLGLIAQPEPDFSTYYAECRQRITDPVAVSYLSARGISVGTAIACGIGYDPQADPANNPGNTGRALHPVPRIIIPTTKSQYVGRSIDPNTEGQYKKLNSKGGKPGLFNEKALFEQEVSEVFVVEGAFDALALIEAGAAAVALNSTSNADKLIKLLEEKPTESILIICCDNDAAGKKANEILREGLQRLNLAFVMGDVCGGYKDPNEFLQADPEGFSDAVEEARRRASTKPDNVSDYIALCMGTDIEKFRTDVKTGYSNLDEKTFGLYSGLYTIAAMPSLGKTTFCSQLADQLAMAGQDVIFFSLEQSKLELVSKSIARMTAILDKERAVTSLQIRRGRGGELAKQAAAEYMKRVGDRLSIVEGNFSCNVSFIGDYVRQYVRRNDKRPVVFVDYLQILQPEQTGNRPQGIRETVDHTVTELKRLSRELNLTVFVISSVNRMNYLTPIAFESLKETGGIEFTSDVIWGLQLKCISQETLFSESDKSKVKEKRARVNQAKAENPRKIELSCLKNRYGIACFSCFFDYYPANDLFKVDTASELDFQTLDEEVQQIAGRRFDL